MSNNNWSATNDNQTEFSYRTNERNNSGIYLNRNFLEEISIIVPNEPENIGETINSDTRVVHTLSQLHQPEQNSEILQVPVTDIEDSNEIPPLQLNSEMVEPVVKPNLRNNTAPSPFPISNVHYHPDMGCRRTQPYIPTNKQHSMPAKQSENGQFSAFRTVNISQSYSSAFRPPDQNQYSHNNNTLGIQVYDRYSSQIPTSSSNRCESVIKYCNPTQNKFECFNNSSRDPRLVNRDKNKYFENRLDKFEGLRRIRYTNKKTYLNEDLRIINMKLKNMNSSYRFGVVNDFNTDDNFNEHNIRRKGEPRVKNTQTDRRAETYIDCYKYLKFFNTGLQQKINFGKMFDVIDDNGDVAREIEARRTSSVLQQYRIEKTELRKLREDHQKKLAETVENIIDSLNDDTSDLKCTTKTLSKKNDGVHKIYNLNDQTKNNAGKGNEKTLTVGNYNFDNTLKNVDICGLIGKNKNNKPLSGQSKETIDLTHEDTADSKMNKNIDTGMFTTKLKEPKIMSGQSIETIDLTHEDTADSRINKNVDTGKLTTKLKEPKIMSMANEQKLKKMYKSSENSEKRNTYKTDKNKLINGPDGITILGYKTSNITKIRVKNASQLIGNNQNEIINSIDTVIGEPCVGVQSNQNTSTKSTKSATNVVGKTHYNRSKLSIRVQDSRETTESNFGNKTSSYENRRSSTDLEKRIHDSLAFLHRGTNEDSLKSNTIQSLPSPIQDKSGTDVKERRLIGYPANMFNKNSTKYCTTSDSTCESNDDRFKIGSFKNVDDGQGMSNTGHQNTDTSETNGSSENATQSPTADFMIDILPPVVHQYSSVMDVEKEVPYIKRTVQIVNENSKSCDENEFNYDSSRMEQSEDSDDEPVLTIDMQATDNDEPGLNEPFDDATKSPGDGFIGNGKSDDQKNEFRTDPEEFVHTTFLDQVLGEHIKTRAFKKGLKNEQNVSFVENQDTKISEFIDDDGQFLNVQRLVGDDVLSADEPPAEQPSADGQLVGEHFEMDYFYNIIKIKPGLFRVNLHNEDDIFNFIQLYSQRTQTSWRVLKSFKSRKYDIRKIFGCLHNGLFKLLKKQDKNMKLSKCDCRSEIDIKIKCSNKRGKKSDQYLKNGLPAIVRFKNKHNHLVNKVTELPLLKSITDNNVKIKFDTDFEPSQIFQDFVNSSNSSSSVSDSSNSSESYVEVVKTNNLSTRDQIPDDDLFSKWDDVDIQCDIVEKTNDKHLEPGQQIINNGDPKNSTCYQLVDTSYSKDYFRKVRGMITDHEKTKWLSNKIATEEDHLSLYKCSGEKCNAVYKNMTTFKCHLNVHCHNAKSQEGACDFMTCTYCFKPFEMNNLDALVFHIFNNYSFCKYFCRYCLYRAYTASHVLIHEYIIHKEQKPSILKLQEAAVYKNSGEIIKMVDFKKFVNRYVCNIGNCDFYSYLNSDFLYHLSQDHVNCDQFYCDICDKCDGNEFVSLNPTSFVKHLNLHSFNTYQCIFCLFGAEFINLMIIHLAMEHFEYEPLCLERRPINNFCDNKKIENLKILNIKKSTPAGIIKVVNSKSLKYLTKKESPVDEKCQANPADTCTNTKTVNIESTTRPSRSNTPIDWSKIYIKYERFYNINQTNDISQTDPVDTCTNENTFKFDNTTQLSRRSTKKVVRPSKNTLTPAIGSKNKTIKSDEVKRNVPIDSKRIPNVGASIIKDKINSLQLSNYDMINNFELKKDIERSTEGKSLETPPCDEPMDQSMSISNKDKVIPAYISYEDHLNQCPLETPIKCSFCLAQSESTFDAVELSKLPMPNCFTCTFCNLELPSTDIAKIHVKEVHNISNVVFVPLDFNSTDIEKDRFLVCEDRCLKRQIPDNDSTFYSEILKNMAIARMKRSKIEKKHDDPQLTTTKNTTNTTRQQIKINPDESEQLHKTTERKHSIESNDIITVKNNTNDFVQKFYYTPLIYKPKQNGYFPQFVPRNKRFTCPLSCNYIGASMESLARHIRNSSHRNNLYYACLHCRPFMISFYNLHDLELHLNFHGIELYICQYCDYIHYDRFKIESHQKRKHPFSVNGENKFNIVAIRSSNPDQETGEWKCNLCMPGIKYTKTQISAHLSIVHKISNMFKCPVCAFDNDDYYEFEQHFKLNHPSLDVKYLNVYFEKISPDVELQSANKQTYVDERAPSKENQLPNVQEAFDGVAEPTPALNAPRETTKSLVVSEYQEKILDNPPGELDGYLKLLNSIVKYVCPVCNEFVIDEKESFREHLLAEINFTLWKCSECFMFSNSAEQMETHVKKHNQLKRKFEKIEINKKNSLVDEIIEYQSIRIEQELHRRNHHQNGTKMYKAMSSLFNCIAHTMAVTYYGCKNTSLY